MYPELCRIGYVTIYSYGASLVSAFIVSYFLIARRAIREGISTDIVFNFLFTTFILGIFGARIFYVVENFSYYYSNPLEIIMLHHGGLSWFGAFIAGLTAALIYLKHKDIPILKMLDLVAPFLALAQSIGRIGCLLNGCCFGKESEFGLYFVTHGKILIPTQLYSSFLLLLIFIFLRFLQDHPHKKGQIFFIYLLLYSLKRFSIEFFRADNQVIFAGLTIFHVLSICVFLVSIAGLIIIRKRKA